MTRKKDKEYKIPIICTGCYQPVDRDKLKASIKADQIFIHDCGKLLHRSRGSGNAEVPTHSHVYDPNPEHTSERGPTGTER